MREQRWFGRLQMFCLVVHPTTHAGEWTVAVQLRRIAIWALLADCVRFCASWLGATVHVRAGCASHTCTTNARRCSLLVRIVRAHDGLRGYAKPGVSSQRFGRLLVPQVCSRYTPATSTQTHNESLTSLQKVFPPGYSAHN